MSNNELQSRLPDQVPLSKSLARNTAKSAASNPNTQRKTQGVGRIGGQLALYTWGTLATLSMVCSAGFLVTEMKIQENIRLTDLEIQQHRHATLVKEKDQITIDLADLPKPTKPIRSLAASLVPAELVDQTTTASISKDQERINGAQVVGFGVKIGASTSTEALTSRYLALANHAPELFIGLRPKIRFSRANQNVKSAKLVVGPFLSEKELLAFCKNVRSRMAVDCSQEDYAGKKLLLPPLL